MQLKKNGIKITIKLSPQEIKRFDGLVDKYAEGCWANFSRAALDFVLDAELEFQKKRDSTSSPGSEPLEKP